MDKSGMSGVHAREEWTNRYSAWTSWQIASEGMPEYEVFKRARACFENLSAREDRPETNGQHSWADLARPDPKFQRAWQDWQRASGGMPEFNLYLRALEEWERVAPNEPNRTGNASW
ncbi:MAG: hypothetical protein EXR45_01990 [Chloroflexi bacterium]|nr:hypothetical protein [Chloroflexota bacterium]